MPAAVDAVSNDEFDQLKSWFKDNRNIFPDEIAAINESLINNYQNLITNKKQQKDILFQLRMAISLAP